MGSVIALLARQGKIATFVAHSAHTAVRDGRSLTPKESAAAAAVLVAVVVVVVVADDDDDDDDVVVAVVVVVAAAASLHHQCSHSEPNGAAA